MDTFDSNSGPDIVDPEDDLLTGTSISMDTDGDGYAETVFVDSDGDGIAEMTIVEDYDTGTAEITIDTDGDGEQETYIETPLANLQDGSEVTDNGGGDEPFVDPNLVDPFEDHTDGDNTDDDTIHGDPQAEIEFHQTQGAENTCLPTSVSMVATELLGEHVDQADVAQMAEDHGFMGESGMSMDGGVTLLNDLGLDAELHTGGTMDDLRTALDGDTDVIIGLDAADLYNGDGGPFDQGMLSGHAVVITGIDDEAGVVYINDPAFPDGAGVEIPIAQFEDAWTDSDHAMISVADPTPDDTTTTDTTDLTSSDGGVAVPTDDYDHLHAGDSATDSGTDSTTVPADGSWLENARAVILPMVFKVQA